MGQSLILCVELSGNALVELDSIPFNVYSCVLMLMVCRSGNGTESHLMCTVVW